MIFAVVEGVICVYGRRVLLNYALEGSSQLSEAYGSANRKGGICDLMVFGQL